jgi:hypothetical protein
MTDLTPESVVVRLYAAYWDGRRGTPEDIAMYLSCNPVGERWKSVAAEHERICSERIAAAEKAARVVAIRECMEKAPDYISSSPGFVPAKMTWDVAIAAYRATLELLITTAEAQPEKDPTHE